MSKMFCARDSVHSFANGTRVKIVKTVMGKAHLDAEGAAVRNFADMTSLLSCTLARCTNARSIAAIRYE